MDNFNFKLRPYKKENYQFVYDLKKTVYQKYVEMNWGKWNEEFQIKLFDSFIQDYGKEIQIIVANGVEIGFFHGNITKAGDYELGNICILPKYQNKGFGSRVLKDIIKNNKTKDIYLKFFKQNPVVKLYTRLGFEIIEELEYHFRMVLRSRKK